jgi:hypothetical protein
MTILQKFKQDLHKAMSKEGTTLKEAVREVIANSPALYSYDLAARVLNTTENKLRCDRKRVR